MDGEMLSGDWLLMLFQSLSLSLYSQASTLTHTCSSTAKEKNPRKINRRKVLNHERGHKIEPLAESQLPSHLVGKPVESPNSYSN